MGAPTRLAQRPPPSRPFRVLAAIYITPARVGEKLGRGIRRRLRPERHLFTVMLCPTYSRTRRSAFGMPKPSSRRNETTVSGPRSNAVSRNGAGSAPKARFDTVSRDSVVVCRPGNLRGGERSGEPCSNGVTRHGMTFQADRSTSVYNG